MILFRWWESRIPALNCLPTTKGALWSMLVSKFDPYLSHNAPHSTVCACAMVFAKRSIKLGLAFVKMQWGKFGILLNLVMFEAILWMHHVPPSPPCFPQQYSTWDQRFTTLIKSSLEFPRMANVGTSLNLVFLTVFFLYINNLPGFALKNLIRKSKGLNILRLQRYGILEFPHKGSPWVSKDGKRQNFVKSCFSNCFWINNLPWLCLEESYPQINGFEHLHVFEDTESRSLFSPPRATGTSQPNFWHVRPVGKALDLPERTLLCVIRAHDRFENEIYIVITA